MLHCCGRKYLKTGSSSLHVNLILTSVLPSRKLSSQGVPEPREDHAVAMARFAKDIVRKMNDLTKRLEVHLGPDTGELLLRVGLHSGRLTAGVIRGGKLCLVPIRVGTPL